MSEAAIELETKAWEGVENTGKNPLALARLETTVVEVLLEVDATEAVEQAVTQEVEAEAVAS